MAMDFISGQMPPAPPGGGAPLDLAAALGGGGAEAAPARSSVDIVQGMLEDGKAYLDVEKDHEDLLTMQKILTDLQKLLTKDQQDADAIASGVTSPRALRKAFG